LHWTVEGKVFKPDNDKYLPYKNVVYNALQLLGKPADRGAVGVGDDSRLAAEGPAPHAATSVNRTPPGPRNRRASSTFTEPKVIRRIVDHLRQREKGARPPPGRGPPVAGQAAASPV